MNYGQFKENKHECYKMVDGCRLVGTIIRPLENYTV